MQSLLPDQRRSSQDRNTLFLMLLIGFLCLHLWFLPNNPKGRNEQEKKSQAEKQDILDRPVVAPSETDKSDPTSIVKSTSVSPQWVTLGSMDPTSPYRMLVTLTNQGAAVVRAELNTEKYRDVQEPSGYLGQIVADERLAGKDSDGVTVQVVGPGTPAHKFGLQVGDKIIRLDRKIDKTEKFETAVVKNFADLRDNLQKTRPGDYIELVVRRSNREADLPLGLILAQHPMDVIRPESVPKNYDEYRQLGGLHGVDFDTVDQLSFLTTLQKVDDAGLALPVLGANNAKRRGLIPRDKTLESELDGVELRREPWELVSSTENEAVFRRTVPKYNLEMRKVYRLAKVDTHLTGTPGTKGTPGTEPSVGAGYHLTLKIEICNLGTQAKTVAYQLDGPTGLPLEGGWYARKTGPGWSGYGIRDIIVRFARNSAQTIDNSTIASDKFSTPWIDEPLDYIGVDSLYFQCTLKPQKPEGEDAWHVRSMPIRVGEKNADWPMLTDVSYRLLSREKTLQPASGPDGDPNSKLEHEFSIFLGPKDTRILAEYGLDETIAYGWFWFAAQPLLGILHFFHGLGMSYAVAIILLTICVRLLIFPMSLKQAAGAEKMKLIQPELQEINEKYKEDMQERSRATSALFKKHNYHPMSGCLPLFIQLPIFIGLYKALSIDAGLYGTPLISSSVRWCSDLSAPDMLFDWSSFWTSIGWPGFNAGQGFLTLGPYFNLLPMLTIVLFLIQQAVMMPKPDPSDQQAVMQRKMMQYMMIFMGFMFFKIPSGLCIYFIVSTLWGLAERRFIPKPAVAGAAGQTYDVTPVDKSYDGHPKEKPKKKREKQYAQQSEKKEEGFWTKMMREVNEKASEQRKLGKADKKKRK